MATDIIPLNEHPSNLDKQARIVAEDRAGRWTVYAVTGGFVLTLEGHRAVTGLFPTQAAALAATV